MKFFQSAQLLLLAFLMAACGGNATPPAFAQANADKTTVTVRLAGNSQSLQPPDSAQLQVGDGVQVDEGGRAFLRFSDFLTVEVLRAGDLQVQELALSEQSALAVFGQSGGAFVNNLEPGAGGVARRVTVESDFAVVTATGTRFLVVKEANSPLEWLLGVDAGVDDLTVRAKNDPSRENPTIKPVGSGVARWIAPVGVPSAGIDYDQAAVNSWLAGVEQGEPVPDIGEVLWSHADMRINTGSLTETLRPGTPLDMGGVGVSVAQESAFGRANYTAQDCNGDGINDVLVQNGIIRLDYRTLLQRVRALDVTLMAGDVPATGSVTVLDPAEAPITRTPFEIAPGQGDVISLRSDQPYHYAEIAIADGCFLGFSLTPPGPADDRTAPVPAVDEWPPRAATVEPTATPTAAYTPPTPVYVPPTATSIPSSPADINIDGNPDDWQLAAEQNRTRWVSFDTIVYDEGCSRHAPYALVERVDLRGRAIFSYDENWLYVAFLVEDDGFIGYTGQDLRFFLSDAPQLLLDLNLDGDANSTRVNEDDKQIDFRVGIEEPGDSPAMAFWDLGPGQAVAHLLDAPIAATATNTGYFVEAAIPWEVLGIEPVGQLRLGVAASVSDNDTPGTNAQECMISTAPERDWQNPTTWGVLTLE
ncbi:MAG: sugar-binding protein [Caldilineaceae bacterium]